MCGAAVQGAAWVVGHVPILYGVRTSNVLCLLLLLIAYNLLQHARTTLTLVHIFTNNNAIKIHGITMLLRITTPAYIITDQQTL